MQLFLVRVSDPHGETRLVRGLIHRGSLEGVLKVSGKVEDIFEQRQELIWFLREDGPPQPGEEFEPAISPVSIDTQNFLGGGPMPTVSGAFSPVEETFERVLLRWEEMKEMVGIVERGDYEIVEDDLLEVNEPSS